MKTVFKIIPKQDEEQSLHLLAEAGTEGIAFLFYTKEPSVAEGVLVYQFDTASSAEQVAVQLKAMVENEPALQQSFSSVNIVYAVREAMLVPSDYQNPMVKEEMLALLYGSNKDAAVFDERVRGREMVNIYRVNKLMVDGLRELFPFSVSYHNNTLTIPAIITSGNKLHCVVYQNNIKIILIKEGKVYLAQHFDYTSATDVVYQLLNACAQYGLKPDDVLLSLTGMIDEKSALYKDLYNYFLQIEFSPMPENMQLADDFDEYPAHFFQHLILLSTCV